MSAATDLYKDKIEINLDGRQVFYLFFGGSIIACMVFVLGVMVGKRVEARAHVDRATSTSAARDPLAAIDRLAASPGSSELSFRQALVGGAAPASDVEQAIAELERARQAAPTKAEVSAKPLPAKPPTTDADAEGQVGPAKEVAKATISKPAPAIDPVKPDTAKASAKPGPVSDPGAADAKPAIADGKGRFTLQLSAFQVKAEAEAFAAEVTAAGYKAYLTEAVVDGKGTFFRVRLGRYGSYDEAVAAKGEFEQRLKKIAYVTRL